MSEAGDNQSQGGGRFAVWCGLCNAAEAFWIELGARDELAAALDVALALYELGHPSPHYLGVRVTYRDADPQRPVYEKIVPDVATRIAKAQPVSMAASRREPSEN
jgi:hypothetical protein